jgi:glycine dehydrogenase
MISIKGEIDRVGGGEWTPETSPLRGAPHTSRAVTGEDWDRAYTRQEAAFPNGPDPDKHWPPVARIDQAYGDRNLVCACPDPSAFAEN